MQAPAPTATINYKKAPKLSLNEYFDEIYCINLKSRPERLASFKKNLKKLGMPDITIFEALDGASLERGDWPLSNGALGCTLSHVAIYTDALKKKHSKILVFEDDAIIKRGFVKSFSNMIATLNSDWDMLYLGGSHHLPPEPVNADVVKVTCTLATHAIAFNCSCLPLILAERNTTQIIDVALANFHPQLRVYAPTEFVAVQSEGYSDIQESHVNYSVSTFDKIFYKLKRIFTGKAN